jgi:hypothetical protein
LKIICSFFHQRYRKQNSSHPEAQFNKNITTKTTKKYNPLLYPVICLTPPILRLN